MARELKLDVEVTGSQKAAREFGRVAGAVDKVGDELRGVGKDSTVAAKGIDNVGDQARQAARHVDNLTDQLAQADRRLKALATSFARTGDTKLLTEIDRQSSALAKLQRAQKIITPGGGGGLESLFGAGLSPSRLLMSAPPPLLVGAGGAGAIAGGGLAAAAVLGGVGLAGVGAGAALSASSDKQVQDAWKDVGGSTLRRLQLGAKDFAEPLIAAAESFGDAFERQEPRIRSILSTASRYVKPLADGLSGAAEEFLPGFERAMKSSEPVVRELGRSFQRLGRTAGDFLELVAGGADGAAGSLDKLVDVVDVLGVAAGGSIAHLSNMAGVLSDIEDAAPGAVFGMTGGIAAWREYQQGAENGGKTNERTALTFKKTVDAADALKNKLHELSDQFTTGFDKAMHVQQATEDYHRTMLGLNETLKENGPTLDTNTRKGLENRDMVLSHLDSIKNLRQAHIDAGGSVGEANRLYGAQVEKLKAVMLQAGFTREAIDKLIGDGRYDVNIVFTTTYKTRGTPPRNPAVYSDIPTGRIGGFAEGGITPPNKPFWVGEKGPELMFSDRPGYVMPHADSVRYASAAAGTGSGRIEVTVNFTGRTGTSFDQAMRSWIQEQIRTGQITISAHQVQDLPR